MKLRRVEQGYDHWCPGCEAIHTLPDSWTFDGNTEQPTFSPSFRHAGIRRVFVEQKWTGEWLCDASGNTIPYVCHYHLISGQLHFYGDSTHDLAGKIVDLPEVINSD